MPKDTLNPRLAREAYKNTFLYAVQVIEPKVFDNLHFVAVNLFKELNFHSKTLHELDALDVWHRCVCKNKHEQDENISEFERNKMFEFGEAIKSWQKRFNLNENWFFTMACSTLHKNAPITNIQGKYRLFEIEIFDDGSFDETSWNYYQSFTIGDAVSAKPIPFEYPRGRYESETIQQYQKAMAEFEIKHLEQQNLYVNPHTVFFEGDYDEKLKVNPKAEHFAWLVRRQISGWSWNLIYQKLKSENELNDYTDSLSPYKRTAKKLADVLEIELTSFRGKTKSCSRKEFLQEDIKKIAIFLEDRLKEIKEGFEK
jgi:hypothetical protein